MTAQHEGGGARMNELGTPAARPGGLRRRALSAFCVALCFAAWSAGSRAATTVTTTSSFDYDLATGLLTKSIVEPEDSALCLVTTYVPDAYGHQQEVITRNCNGSPAVATDAPNEAPAPTGLAAFAQRSLRNLYSADQRFVTRTTNSLDQYETKTYDGRFGTVTALRGTDQVLPTTWAYDGLGRKTLEIRADGTRTRWSYVHCLNPGVPYWPSAPVGATTATCETVPAHFTVGSSTVGPSAIMPVYYIQATPLKSDGTTAEAYTRVYYDSLGREIRTETQGFDGSGSSQPVLQDTAYELAGNVSTKSLPYSPGVSPYAAIGYTHDVLGRTTRQLELNAAGGSASTWTAYSGLSTTVTDPRGFSTTQVKNPAGQIATITDAKGGVLQRAYDPMGNLVRITDARGNVTSMVYDNRGRKTAMYDPDMGVWGYCYDALGQIKAQQDSNGRGSNTLAQCPAINDVGATATAVPGWVTMAYDVLGRMTQRVEPDLRSTWSYDNCSTGVGKLCAASADNGYNRTHAYDSLGRPSSTTAWRNGIAYTASVGYDASTGRVSAQTYPTGLTVNRVDTPLGYPWRVVDGRNGLELWRAQKQDAMGHYLQYQHGNGLVTTNAYFADGSLNTTQTGPNNTVQDLVYGYDLNRNISARVDMGTTVTVAYAYDELNRLTSESRSGGGLGGSPQVIAWGYDALGNMSTRTESGNTNTYHYNTSGLGSLRPHAVGSVSGQVSAALAPSYSYDANGNLTSGAGRTVTWTSANMVKTVSAGSAQLSYRYGPEHERFEETYTRNGAEQRTTVYINPGEGEGLFYEEESGAAGLKMKHYISAGGSTVAMIVCTATPCTSTANTSTQYWHEDHLGSVSVVTNQVGAVVERMAYEPFGKRRYSNGVTDPSGTLTPSSTDRGYTEHEHMDEVGLINMNGRVYDPGLGRFMSADPNVPHPDATQSYNRYSYTQNNPLRMLDPSGFEEVSFGGDGYSLSADSPGFGGWFITLGNFSCLPGDVSQVSSGLPMDPQAAPAKSTPPAAQLERVEVNGSGSRRDSEAARTEMLRKLAMASPNRFVAHEAGCIGREGTCAAVGLSFFGGAWLLGTPMGQAALTSFGWASWPLSDVPVPMAGAPVAKTATDMVRAEAAVAKTAADMARVQAAVANTAERVRVGQLIPTHGRMLSNNKLSDLVKKLRAEGIKDPVTVTEHGGRLYILDGHHRALAAPRAGIAEVPIKRVDLPWGAYKTPKDLDFTPGIYP
jgi:RHS repeat-associated protein